MAFSNSFFAVETDTERPAPAGSDENANNRSPEMAVGNNGSRQRSEEEGPEQPPVSDNQSSSRQLPEQPEQQRQQSLPPLPSLSPSRQLMGPSHRQSENMATSDGTDQLASDDKSTMASAKSNKSSTKRKKGIASSVTKTPKRPRPGTGKKSNSKRSALSPTTLQNRGGTKGGDGDGDDSSSGESDSGPYCLCRGPDNHRFMIACDRCEDWFHGDCIGMDKYTGEVLVYKYICPNCSDGKRYVTRYKKMCSLDGCKQPARIYDIERPSIFCSQEHCQSWWEQLVASLPKSKGTGSLDILTQGEFVGLLDSPARLGDKTGLQSQSTWKLGDTPFGISPGFWDEVDLNTALTPEERAFLDRSASERYSLGEDIVLHKKGLQLIEMALKQREAAIIPTGTLTKDVCGYDTRLDTVGVKHQFSAFMQSPEGEAIFKAGRLEPPTPSPSGDGGGGTEAGSGPMCTKKKCKTHQMWGAILVKNVKHNIKELAAQAKEKLDAETRMRDNAAGRFRRRQLENNTVVVFNDSEDDEGDSSDEGEDVEMA